MHLIDTLHQRGIGVILDWVPAHFPHDEHGLGYFDGTHLYEHADPRQGHHPDWDTFIFNYGRNEVRSFLISNALFWLDCYHVDALRVDAVASMLYLDYGRQPGRLGAQPVRRPGKPRGHRLHPPAERGRPRRVSRRRRHRRRIHLVAHGLPADLSRRPGLHFKWNMGWMHDMLDYMTKDPIHRSYHHNLITFSLMYAFSENFVLPLSHDEVVHLKRSMISKMPGDDWQKFANLRLLYGYMFGHPGKKLLFMGDEFGQWREWNHDQSLDWHLLGSERHRGLQRWVRDINTLYRGEPALHRFDCDHAGFAWIDCNDNARSVISFIRRGGSGTRPLIFACNFTPVPLMNYRVGAPVAGYWEEILNSDAHLYGGSGLGNFGGRRHHAAPAARSSPIAHHHAAAAWHRGLPRAGPGGRLVSGFHPSLGATWTGRGTKFRVWAPEAAAVGLVVESPGRRSEHPMRPDREGYSHRRRGRRGSGGPLSLSRRRRRPVSRSGVPVPA